MANVKKGIRLDYHIPKAALSLGLGGQELPTIDGISETLRRAAHAFIQEQAEDQQQLTRILQMHLQEAHKDVPPQTIEVAAQYFSHGIWALLSPRQMSLEDFHKVLERDFGSNLATRFRRLVAKRGITSLEELTKQEARYMGPESKLVHAIRLTLAKFGLRLRGDLDGDPLTQRFFSLVEEGYTSNLVSHIATNMRIHGILNARVLISKEEELKQMKFGPLALEAITAIIPILKAEQGVENA